MRDIGVFESAASDGVAASIAKELDIASEDAFNPMTGRILERKGGNCCLDASACPLDGRILASGVQ